jgi:hypothetical protein
MFTWLLIALAGLEASQPAAESAQVCTPASFDAKTMKVGCSEGYYFKLWGVRAKPHLRLSNIPPDQLAALFNSQAGRWQPSGVIKLEASTPMRCRAKGSRGSIAQCFVKSPLVFGDEDLACRLIGSRIVVSARSGPESYSLCSKFKPG